MKKYITYLLLLHFYVYGTEIEVIKYFKTKIQTDHLFVTLNLTQEDSRRQSIEKIFSKAISIAKESEICKGGNYNIYPRYSYVNNRRDHLGYHGNLNFECFFKDETKLENILDSFDKLRDIKISQSDMEALLTPEQDKMAIEKLELLAYKFAKKYTIFLTHNFATKCSVKKIKFYDEEQEYPRPVNRMLRVAQEPSSVTTPIDAENVKSLKALYIFACKD